MMESNVPYPHGSLPSRNCTGGYLNKYFLTRQRILCCDQYCVLIGFCTREILLKQIESLGMVWALFQLLNMIDL